MDQAFKENLHFFMIGLGVVLTIVALSIIVLYFMISRNVKKKKQAENK